ncbi:hypothetical protein HYPSUDRAFT_202856 [Hypholoma sublateritium FD-334 SS-4]|uniref:Uncharacterized protein n=1 Tax=Hypholoma sublateritium (strain FD-334 SS-4) TaxID=945553 RepID=A0A0D2L3X0_HYPSF|nr:hypothetical protein HYPSUDRAFT_202856 [Hypholoma sublateritium FD-334 SS-4]
MSASAEERVQPHPHCGPTAHAPTQAFDMVLGQADMGSERHAQRQQKQQKQKRRPQQQRHQNASTPWPSTAYRPAQLTQTERQLREMHMDHARVQAGVFLRCRGWVRAVVAHAPAVPMRLRGAGRADGGRGRGTYRAARSLPNLWALALALPSVEVETGMDTNYASLPPQAQGGNIESDERAAGVDDGEKLAAMQTPQSEEKDKDLEEDLEGRIFDAPHPDTPIATQSARGRVRSGRRATRQQLGGRQDRGRVAGCRRGRRAPHYPPPLVATRSARASQSVDAPAGPEPAPTSLEAGRGGGTPVLSVKRHMEGADALLLLSFSMPSPPPSSLSPSVKIVVVVDACRIRCACRRQPGHNLTSVPASKIRMCRLNPTQCSGAKPPHLWRPYRANAYAEQRARWADEAEQLCCGDESAHFEEVVAVVVEFAIAWGMERPAVEERSVLVAEEKADVPEEEKEEDMEESAVPFFAFDASAEDERTPESSASLLGGRVHKQSADDALAPPPAAEMDVEIVEKRSQKSNEEPFRIGDAVVVEGPIAPVLGECVEEAKWEGRGMCESELPGSLSTALFSSLLLTPNGLAISEYNTAKFAATSDSGTCNLGGILPQVTSDGANVIVSDQDFIDLRRQTSSLVLLVL